jgi:hypothetical protein
VPGADAERGLGVLALGILDVLRFVEDGGGELDAAVTLGVAAQQRVAGDDQIACPERRAEELARSPPSIASTRRSGVNARLRAAS